MKQNHTNHNVLYVDVGSVNTRVCLFDNADGKYAFIGAASANGSSGNSNQTEYLSIVEAVQKLERATRRKLLDRNQNIVMPVNIDRTGVDQVAVSYTRAADPRIALMGLTHGGSLKNMRDLLSSVGIEPIVEICSQDGKSTAENLDLLLNAAPRIVILGGGLEAGAETGVYRLGEILMLACRSLPREQRPIVLFMGNSAAKSQMDRVISRLTDLTFTANVLEPGTGVQSSLNGLINVLRKDLELRTPGFKTLREKTKSSLIPGEFSFGRSIRLMSRLIRQNHHVLGIDIGARQTIFADAVNLNLSLQTLPMGVGNGIARVLDEIAAAEIVNWIGFQIKASEVQDYIMNKCYYPELVPANKYSAEIELAIARLILRRGIENSKFPINLTNGSLAMVLLSGALLRNVEDPGEALRVAMDSLAPAGMVDYLLDMNGLTGAIGTLAHQNPVLTAQIMNTSVYLNLGRVIRPLSAQQALGKPVMKISLQDEAGNVREYDVPNGRIFRIPLEYGRNYELNWISIPRSVTIPGVKTWAPVGFKSGCFGLIFDTREVKDGKMKLPNDKAARLRALESWREELGTWLQKPDEEGSDA